MGTVEREMSRLLSYARLHPPGDWEAWRWYLTATVRPAVHWALLLEARRPRCIWYAKKDESFELSPDDLALVKEWKTNRHYSWQSGCMIPGGTGVINSPASRKMSDAYPDMDTTADVFERFARAIPPLAYSWAAEWPSIMEKRPKFPKGFPLRSMFHASSLISVMGDRFTGTLNGEGRITIGLNELPEWARLFLYSPTGEWGPRPPKPIRRS